MANFADNYDPNNTVSPTGPPQDYATTKASPQEMGAEVGQAVQGLGQAIGGAEEKGFDTLIKYQQLQNETTANQSVQAYAKFASDREMQLRQLQGANATAALPQYQKDMQDQLNTIAKGIQSPMARVAFMTDARNFYDRSLYSAGMYVGDESRKATLQSYEGKYKATVDFTTLHYNDPKALAQGISDATDIALSLAHQQGVDETTAHAMVSQKVGGLVDSAITMQLSQGTTLKEQLQSVKAAQAMFKQYTNATIPGSPGIPMLDAQQADSLSQKLNSKQFQLEYRMDRQEATNAAHMAVAVHANLNNAIAMTEQGITPQNIPSDAQIAAAYPKNPEMAAIVQERAQSVRDMSHFTQVIPTATPAQIFQLREETHPDPSKPDFAGQVRRYNALNTVINQRSTALSKDPAGYAIQQHPELQQSYMAADKNPAFLPQYAESVHTTQTALGIPEYKQHVLPAGVAQTLASQVSANPASAQSTMKGLQQKYGYLWPSVFHDMATIGGLPVQYQSVANLQGSDATLLARVIQDKATGKAIEDTLPDITANGKTIKSSQYIKNSLATPGSGLYQYMNSLTQSGASPGQVAAFKDSVSSLAMAYIHYDNIPADQAVKKAEKAFLGNTQFLGSARIPSEKFDAVTQNAQATLHNLNPGNITWPKGIGEVGAPKMDEYLDTLKATPTWVTSPKDDALWLMDVGGRFVRDHQGNPVSVPFNSPPITRKEPSYTSLIPAP